MLRNREKRWIAQIFEAKSVSLGGIVRRKIQDVETQASMAELKQAVRRRGFELLVREPDVIILCTPSFGRRAA